MKRKKLLVTTSAVSQIALEIGDLAGREGLAYGNFGGAYRNLGDTQRALDYYVKRLEVLNKLAMYAAAASSVLWNW